MGQSDPAPSRPAGAGRVVHVFDFEEKADPSREGYNPEPVPRHWVRAQHNPPSRERLGVPLGNKAEYDLTMSWSGKVSVKLPTTGGSTALRLSGTLLPVFPSVDYAVEAAVRTAGLRQARAFLTARLLDERGDPLANAAARSEPLLGEDGWNMVRIQLPGGRADAAFVELELLLLQPEQFLPKPMTVPHHVWDQDLAGAAWFDDIAVMQLPRVVLESTALAGIAIGPDAPQFIANVRDLTGEEMTARLTLVDMDDAVIATLDQPLVAGGGRVEWAPQLPRYGWYEAGLEVFSGEKMIGRSRARVLWMPAEKDNGTGQTDRDRPMAARFGLLVEQMREAEYELIPLAVRAMGVGSVSLPLGEAGDPKLSRPEWVMGLRELIEPLLTDRIQVTLSFQGVEESLARKMHIDPGDPVALFEQDSTKWLPSLRPVFDVFGQRVQRWSFGSGHHLLGALRDDLPARLAALRGMLSRVVPGPIVSVPWRGEWQWPVAASGQRPAADVLVVEAPYGFPLASLGTVAREWTGKRSVQTALTVKIQTPPAEEFGRGAAVTELIKRAATLWEALDPWGHEGAAPTALAIVQPWSEGLEHGSAIMPEATLGVWRTLTQRLGPRRVAGRLPGPAGMTCMVLLDARPGVGGRRSAALLVWSEGAPADSPEMVVHLGPGPLMAVDPMGNESPVKPLNTGGQYRIAAQPTPVFIEGVDGELALFVEGLKLDPPFVRAVAEEHDHHIVITNPWPTQVAGQVQLAPPARSPARRSWRFTPTAAIPFALAPGETVRLPMTFAFSAAEESGPTELTAIVRLTVGVQHPPLLVSVPIMIGLADLELQPGVLLSPTASGPDVIVTAVVNNKGSRSRTLQVEAGGSGVASQQQPISDLQPGEIGVRRFVFKGAAGILAGKRMRLTLSDVDGPERLNRSVVVP